MSKWFSARSNLAVLALAACLAAAACTDRSSAGNGEGRRSSTVTEADLRVDEVPQEEPGVARTRWRAANPAARDVAGNLTVSLEEGRGGPLALAFANGITLRAEELAVFEGGDRVGAGEATFRALLVLPDAVRTRVYRVIDEHTARSAANGGLCGAQSRTTNIAASEFVDEEGDWALRIAAFKGARAPGERGGDPELCAAFAYKQPR